MSDVSNMCYTEFSLDFLLDTETKKFKEDGTENVSAYDNLTLQDCTKCNASYIMQESDVDFRGNEAGFNENTVDFNENDADFCDNDVDFRLLEDIDEKMNETSKIDFNNTLLCRLNDDSVSLVRTRPEMETKSLSILSDPNSSGDSNSEENNENAEIYPSMSIDIFAQEFIVNSEALLTSSDLLRNSATVETQNTILLTPTETLFPPLLTPTISTDDRSMLNNDTCSDLVSTIDNITNPISATKSEHLPHTTIQFEFSSAPNSTTFSPASVIESELSSPASSEEGGQFTFSGSDEDTFYTQPGSEEDEILTNPSSEEDELCMNRAFDQHDQHVSINDLFSLFNPPPITSSHEYHSLPLPLSDVNNIYTSRRKSVTTTGKREVGETTGTRRYTCKDCGKEFGRSFHLKRHRIIHTGQKPYKCQPCGKTFHDISHLRAHSFVHSGAKQFKCDDCGKEFNRKDNLDSHIMTHNTDFHPHSCKVCKRTFRRHSNLVIHARIHNENKPYPCNQCDKTFHIASSLKRHLLTHW